MRIAKRISVEIKEARRVEVRRARTTPSPAERPGDPHQRKRFPL
jgi:hypothetical protein